MKKMNKVKIKTNQFNNKYLFKILIIIFIITTISLIAILLFKRSTLDVNSKEITSIYDYISNDNIEKCNGFITYDDKLITYNDLSKDSALCIAFNKTKLNKENAKIVKLKKDKGIKACTLEPGKIFATDNYKDNICTIKRYDTELIAKTYKKIFGKEIDNTIKSFTIDNYNICYLYKNEYYCGLSETFSFTIGNQPYIYRLVNNAIKENDSIIIYDYFIKYNNELCYKSYLGSTENKKCTKNYSEDNKIDYKFIKKYGTKYKHIFKEDKESKLYSWVSSEPIN